MIYKCNTFAKQLIIYLLAVLIITFLFISFALTNSVQQFIGNNAYSQAQIFAGNVQKNFEKEILKIESIPDKIIHIDERTALQNISELPGMLLKAHPQLIGCSVYCNPCKTKLSPSIIATRSSDGNIKIQNFTSQYPSYPSVAQQVIRKSKRNSFWIFSQIDQSQTIAFCYPLCNSKNQNYGFLKLDFPLKTITDIICDNKIYKYGNLFITDSAGNYLSHHFQLHSSPQSTYTLLKQKINQGETGSSTYYKDNTKYFIYYSPLPCMNWRLGIVCPYNEILTSSHKLYWVIFLCLGGGLLFLFIGTINIVHRLSSPLKQLAFIARQMADGHLDTQIPKLKTSNEINELYDSFRYMQHSIINYIDKLKISTAEKEQRNSEMNMARRIQERFLPQHITMPSNLELAAELRQSREVGGDLYEFFIVSNRLYFAIGDVSGKGTPAALYMVSICKLFRYIASCNSSTATICNLINKHMCEDAEDDMYATIFMGIIDLNTGIMTYTNAGHPYPLVIHENGETNFLRKYPDVPVGVLEDHSFMEHTYTLHKNVSLLFYTDGITDAEDLTGQFYGKEKLIKCMQAVYHESPQMIIQTILADIQKHITQRNQSDDLTLLFIRYKGIPS